MKKNRMMRIAAVLLIAVLLSTSVISGTFAKYTSSATVADDARVAYWGFGRVAAETFDLFADTYDGSVDSEDDANVVAPGTAKKTSFAFPYTNYKNDQITAPEVDYSFTVEATIAGDYTALDENENFYWTLDDTPYATVALLEAAIEAMDGNKDYEAGDLPDGFGVGDSHTIGWVWEYETKNGDVVDAAQDAVDTAMGNADTLANVAVTIKITATQID